MAQKPTASIPPPVPKPSPVRWILILLIVGPLVLFIFRGVLLRPSGQTKLVDATESTEYGDVKWQDKKGTTNAAVSLRSIAEAAAKDEGGNPFLANAEAWEKAGWTKDELRTFDLFYRRYRQDKGVDKIREWEIIFEKALEMYRSLQELFLAESGHHADVTVLTRSVLEDRFLAEEFYTALDARYGIPAAEAQAFASERRFGISDWADWVDRHQ